MDAEKEQKIYVVAFILHEGKLLILKRNSKSELFPGYYELPGGKVEFGETPQEALKRELMEELGVKVEVLKPYNSFSFLSKQGKRHGVEICFHARLLDAPSKIVLHEHEDLKWA